MDKFSIGRKFADLSLLQKSLLYVSVVGGLVLSYWFFILDPKLGSLSSLQRQIVQVEQTIVKYRAMSANLAQLERTLESRKKELYYAKTLLPEDARQLEVLLASFEKLGKDENVDFLLFLPGAEQAGEFYATRGVQVQISGTYHKLMTYFDRLTRLDRLVSIQNIVFSPVGDYSPTEKILRADVNLLVYRALTEAELKAREAAKQKK